MHAAITDDQASADEGLALLRRSAATTPEASLPRAARLSDLSAALRDSHARSGDLGEINEAVTLARQAVQAATDGDVEEPRHLLNLCSALQSRWEATDDRRDAERPSPSGGASAAVPDGHLGKARFLAVFGSALMTLYELTDQPEQLDEAIGVQRRAVAALPAEGFLGASGVRQGTRRRAQGTVRTDGRAGRFGRGHRGLP